MKKLLVILLLFFPVHSAWAERMELSCRYETEYSYKDDKTSRVDVEVKYIIDTNNPKGLQIEYTHIDDKRIHWIQTNGDPKSGVFLKYIEYRRTIGRGYTNRRHNLFKWLLGRIVTKTTGHMNLSGTLEYYKFMKKPEFEFLYKGFCTEMKF